jgi:hypothetical protein
MVRFLLKVSLLVGMVFLFMSSARAQEEKYITLYLYNFTKHIEWPDEYQGGDFVIEVLGHNSVYVALQDMLSEKSRGKQTFVVNHPSSVDQINPDCNILFVGHWRSKDIANALNRVGDKGTLVVSEKAGMLEQGADINLVIKNQKILYEMKKSSLTSRGLSYSVDLTSLAERVVD